MYYSCTVFNNTRWTAHHMSCLYNRDGKTAAIDANGGKRRSRCTDETVNDEGCSTAAVYEEYECALHSLADSA
jgi:hypothetical protein